MSRDQDKKEKLWGGRFSGETAPLAEDYTQSVSFDRSLYIQDIEGSKAHARMLGKQGILSREDTEKILEGLDRVKEEIESGNFQWRTDLEDVHMNIEDRLTRIAGRSGQKLHTGRSRNDQIALDFRLFVGEALLSWQELIFFLIKAFRDRAEENISVLLPGYTHMQPAQPVSLGHHLLAYCQMLRRDFERASECRKRTLVSPLGAAALAGTTYNIDPVAPARELGMHGCFKNSMDAVSDRDFVMESVFVAAVIMTHLSRFCEEIIVWSNPGFGFVHLPDDLSTGSSIMPQKKNPDVAEIMRGKTARVYGNQMTLMTLMKALPLAYNRDMQEDKEPFLDTDKTVRDSLRIMAQMVRDICFNPLNMEKALRAGFLNATELADYLAEKGVPFREAHRITGEAVAFAESRGMGLEDLGLEDLQAFSPVIDQDVFAVLDYRQAVARRESPGGTGPKAVAAQIAELDQWMAGCRPGGL
ncbi:MAG: argininosuccinate lyase [Desulfonatronovibrionaceae bacterium]